MTAPVVRWRVKGIGPGATHWLEVDLDGRTTRLSEDDAASLETQLAQHRAMVTRYHEEQAAAAAMAASDSLSGPGEGSGG